MGDRTDRDVVRHSRHSISSADAVPGFPIIFGASKRLQSNPALNAKEVCDASNLDYNSSALSRQRPLGTRITSAVSKRRGEPRLFSPAPDRISQPPSVKRPRDHSWNADDLASPGRYRSPVLPMLSAPAGRSPSEAVFSRSRCAGDRHSRVCRFHSLGNNSVKARLVCANMRKEACWRIPFCSSDPRGAKGDRVATLPAVPTTWFMGNSQSPCRVAGVVDSTALRISSCTRRPM